MYHSVRAGEEPSGQGVSRGTRCLNCRHLVPEMKTKASIVPCPRPCGGEAARFVNDPSEARALDNAEPSRATRRAGGGYACSDTGAMRAALTAKIA
ncbi:MAG: hypothetical protein G01um101417_241 [Parcubacteria group bacterium Gr01-1014_17]|nr:MAG: hypothetical protein G01um101417_241 [Parcubacteria group bacterium Gr01-1014_17]